MNCGRGISYEIALRWIPLDLTDDKSILIAIRQQAITWANVYPDLCRQMASLGLNELRAKSSALFAILFAYLYWVSIVAADDLVL